MHAHPMPAISLGILLRVGTRYDDLYHWQRRPGSCAPRSASTPAAPATPTFKAHRPPCGSWPPP
jgi:hypothetical protein